MAEVEQNIDGQTIKSENFSKKSLEKRSFTSCTFGSCNFSEAVLSLQQKGFFAGYKSIRQVPDYSAIMPFLRLNRAIATIGFTVKRGIWDNSNARVYQFNHRFLESFF